MAAWQPVVKDGKFYHYYPKGRSGTGRPEYIYVRAASGSDPKTGGAVAPNEPAAGGAPARPGGASAATAAPPGARPAAPINPFLTADDLASIVNFNFGNASTLADVDKGMADLKTNTDFQRTDTNKRAVQGTVDTTDQMIGRGLFRSSIKDAALYDIEATRTLQNKFFDDQLTNASLDADRRKKGIADADAAFKSAMNLKAVENAAAASANQPVSVPDAAAAPAPGAPAPAAAAAVKPNNVVKNGKFYHHYPRGRDGNSAELWVYVRPAS